MKITSWCEAIWKVIQRMNRHGFDPRYNKKKQHMKCFETGLLENMYDNSLFVFRMIKFGTLSKVQGCYLESGTLAPCHFPLILHHAFSSHGKLLNTFTQALYLNTNLRYHFLLLYTLTTQQRWSKYCPFYFTTFISTVLVVTSRDLNK